MILAGLVFVVGPRMIERARITSWTQTCNEIRTTAVAFLTKKAVGADSFPPAYGYLKESIDPARQNEIGQPDPTDNKIHDERFFCMVPYISKLGYMRNYDVYDPFAKTSHDTDRDNVLSMLEFSLVGEKDARIGEYVFSPDAKTILYNGANLSDETSAQLKTQRPMLYIPVNLAQAKLVSQYYAKIMAMADNESILAGGNATRWNSDETFPTDPNDPNASKNPLKQLRFPPNRYDDFLLISVGPAADTGGIVTPMRVENGNVIDYSLEFLANVNKFDWYHVLALRAYYLATRDINGNHMQGNGLLDFDFRNRTRSGEAKPESYSQCKLWDNTTNLPGELCHLPNGTNGAGPLIYMPNKASGK